MGKNSRSSLAVLGAVGSVVLIGCASVDPKAASAWRVEPLLKVASGADPANGRAYFALGQAYAGEARWQQAAEAYAKAAFADPDHAEAYHALGIAQAALSRYGAAVAAFTRAVDIEPESAQYLNNLGYALLLAGQYARAQPYLRAALARDPGHEQARLNLDRVSALLAADAVIAQAPPASAPAPVAPAGDAAEARSEPAGSVAEPPRVPSDPIARDERLSGFRIEIANGNGVRGAAARLRGWLHARGVEAQRLTNLKPYTHPTTVVQYQPGYLPQAIEVARRMPDGVDVAEANQASPHADVRVVIGRDASRTARCRPWPCETPQAIAQTAVATPR